MRLLFRHVLPNISEPLVVNATIGAGGALLSFAGLSFLGLGVQQPQYDWGRLLFDGIGSLYVNPAAALCPGIAVIIAGLAFNLFGESVAKALGVGVVGGIPELPSVAAAIEDAPPVDESHQAADDLVLDVRDLQVTFPGPHGPIRPVRGVSFGVRRGEAVGIVGESGSGKSLTALAISRLVDDSGRVDATRLELLGNDLRAADSKAHRQFLGTSLAMVFQDPMTSFNPTRRMGGQLAESARHNQGLGRKAALARAVDRLRAVRITEPEKRAHQYPHEFSGGMRQRAMIGMGLMGSPALIVADEPTTALDVTVQQQVLDLLAAIRAADDVALVLISHDVTVVREVCDRVLVMYAGRIVEDLPAERPRDRRPAPLHPRADGRGARHGHRPGRAARGDPRPAGRPRRRTARVRVRRPLPARLGALPHRGAVLVADAAGRRVACWHPGEPVLLEITDRDLEEVEVP